MRQVERAWWLLAAAPSICIQKRESAQPDDRLNLLLLRNGEVLRLGESPLGSRQTSQLLGHLFGEGTLTQRHSTRGAWLIIVASLIAMAICVFDYYTPETGLIGTGGVVLVAIAALLMFLASLTMALVPNRSCLLQGFLVVSIILDIIGSSVAGYFLESPVIMAAEALALIGWLMNVIGDAADRSVEIDDVED
jgi:hypothetical protein